MKKLNILSKLRNELRKLDLITFYKEKGVVIKEEEGEWVYVSTSDDVEMSFLINFSDERKEEYITTTDYNVIKNIVLNYIYEVKVLSTNNL